VVQARARCYDKPFKLFSLVRSQRFSRWPRAIPATV